METDPKLKHIHFLSREKSPEKIKFNPLDNFYGRIGFISKNLINFKTSVCTYPRNIMIGVTTVSLMKYKFQ